MNFLKEHTGIVSALIVGIAIISSAFLLTQGPFQGGTTVVASPSSALQSQVIEKDSDGDGLPDWEEALWGTDPFLVDSDGDGILDGDYVRSRSSGRTLEELITAENLNFSERFSREFFAAYLQFKADGSLSGDEQGKLIELMLSGTDANLPAIFSTTEISVIPATEQTINEYIQQVLVEINAASSKKITKSELTILEEALESGAYTQLAPIKDIAKGYASLAAGLKEVDAPQGFVETHAALITAADRLSVIIDAFANADTEALRALSLLPEYEKEVLRLARSLSGSIDRAVFETGGTTDEAAVLKAQLGL